MRLIFIIALVAAALALPSTARAAKESWIRVGKIQERALLILPESAGPHPAVLVLHPSDGLGGAEQAYGERLAEQGYVVLVPAFLEPYGVEGKFRRESFTGHAQKIYDDLGEAVDWLRQHPAVAGSRIGAVGFSNGGFFTVWLAATHRIDAGISYYGAINGAGTDREMVRFQKAFSKTSAPIFILQGSADDYFRPAHRLVGILKDASAPFRVRFYPDATHGFDRLGTEIDRAAAADAWDRSLRFLENTLKTDKGPD